MQFGPWASTDHMHKKRKGSVAELAVATRLMRDGWQVLLPYGENTRYDLVAEKNGRFIRIRVKYVTPKAGTLEVNCQSSNDWSVLPYTAAEIDAFAVYNGGTGDIYYVRVSKSRRTSMRVRLEPTKNHEKLYIRFAKDFTELRDGAVKYLVSGAGT